MYTLYGKKGSGSATTQVALEVVGVLPRTCHLGRGGVGIAAAAHAHDDALGEEHPQLLVVVELGVPFERIERGPPGLVVQRGVEREPISAPDPDVAVGPEVRPGHGDREVDVEDDGAKLRHAADDSRTTGANLVRGP